MNNRPHISAESVPDQTIEHIIPAKQSRRIVGLANRFYFAEATGPIRVKTGVIPERTFNKGLGKRLPSPGLFTYAELHNDNDYDVRIELEWTFGDLIDNRLNIVTGDGASLGIYDAKCEMVAEPTLAGGTMANNDEILFDATAVAPRHQRKRVTISNKSTSANLILKDEADLEIGFIPPVTVMEFDHQTNFKLVNESGEAVDAKAFTTWTLLPY